MPVKTLLQMKRHDERGVSMVLFALLMVTFTVFVAFAVDIGGVANQRRRAQLSDDAGVLGAAQDLPFTASARGQVISLVNQDLGVSWTAGTEWNTCGSISAPSGFTKDNTSNCIAYDSSFTRVWASVPAAGYATSFGKVIGVNSINVSAQAIARKATAGFGGVLPFGIPATAGGSGQVCLKTGPSGHIDSQPPCNGPDSGNFGTLDILWYFQSGVTPSADCNAGGGTGRLPNNIAAGVDHQLSIYTGTEVVDQCGVPAPNAVAVQTGNAGALDQGIITGNSFGDGQPARLRRVGDTSGDYYTQTTNIDGHSTVNDTGLWQFMKATPNFDTPNSCAKSVFTTALTDGVPDNKTQLRLLLDACFAEYSQTTGPMTLGCSNQPCAGVLFDNNSRTESGIDLYDIQLNPRFAYVPRLTGVWPPGNSGTVRIASFQAVYIQRLFIKCGGTCDVDFDPGVNNGGQSANGGNAEAITAYAFNPTMLPGSLGSNPYQLGQSMSIQLIK